ncbi:uncharacterized protein J7T54_007483 [Emericellopsis cladophorae]|uniref:Uncharacterized protein n=1 Tax=Emericellopsis cladophorae TaxID=2686198 RepID=A0A9Q0BC60_9HYPO|nr:uncharacterized protein J7T54_007483 [Emericellopsis cladophorae]KAI6780007.1 hypothetical protein J7T54_007483 [Emericellopsis cladophorae]
MHAPTRLLVQSAFPRLRAARSLHTTILRAANVAPVVGTGPPPEAPLADKANKAYERVERRKRQAEMLKSANQIRTVAEGKKSGVLQKRFWQDVTVREVDGALQVFLDSRPLRHPNTKEVIPIPLSKPNLASALALEWDQLTSAQEATRSHLIPLTSLVCRALDIQADDAAASSVDTAPVRTSIVNTVMRYLDTDSMLCWAPPAGPFDLKNDAGESLRDVQTETAKETLAFLTSKIWPGVTITPALDGDSIMPRSQSPETQAVVRSWISRLDAFEIAGLERGTLAGKSVLASARLVAEWSEGSANTGDALIGQLFGAEEAVRATNLEVDWQAMQWGEVEDTYDVNKEDVTRQLASVILLVSGTGKA